jgi:hypothetical protein
MLQVWGSEVAAVHADRVIELAVVERGAGRLLVRDLRDDARECNS